jgi:hypothetical protein
VSEGEKIDSSAGDDNPFTRESRDAEQRSGPRSAPRPRGRGRNTGEARPADADRAESRPARNERAPDEDSASFDPGVLPPSIQRDEEPAPRPRGRRRARPAENGDDEALEAVS